MKKLLAIVVLVFLLSTNIYANEVYLTCDNNRIMSYYKSGGVSDEPGIDELDITNTFQNLGKKRVGGASGAVLELLHTLVAQCRSAHVGVPFLFLRRACCGEKHRVFNSIFLSSYSARIASSHLGFRLTF